MYKSFDCRVVSLNHSLQETNLRKICELIKFMIHLKKKHNIKTKVFILRDDG